MGLLINGISVAGPGAPGKSAYEYAQEGGFTGTEEEFMARLAGFSSGPSNGDTDAKISLHNINTSAHNDIRALISTLQTRLNTLADSDDITLDQLSEIVAYIKNNKTLIDGVTTSKVSKTDIINDLTTTDSLKVLSAAQGVALKNLIDNGQKFVIWNTSESASTPVVVNGAIMIKFAG